MLKKALEDSFFEVYGQRSGLVATFGGTGDPKTGENKALPKVLNVKETDGYYEVTYGKSYAFRSGGSEPTANFKNVKGPIDFIKRATNFTMNKLGIEADTKGADLITSVAAPIAAKIGITGDDKYFNKNRLNPFTLNLYNSPDMHYEVKVKIPKTNQSSTSDTFASVASPQQTFSQMQQRIRNSFSNNTQTNTDAPPSAPLIPRNPTIKIGKVGKGVYDLSKTYNDTGSPDTPLTQPSAPQDSGEAGYNKLKDKVPNLPSWSNLGSGIELPDTPKPPSGTLDAQAYNDALDAWTYEKYMKQYNALMDKAAAQADPIERERLKYSPGGFEGVQKTYTPAWAGGRSVEPPGLTDALNVINDALAKALGALTAAWERYQKSLQPPVGGGQMKGGQGGLPLGSTTQRQGGAYNPQNPFGTGTLADSSFKKNKKQKGMKESKLSFELIQQFREESNPRIPRKKGQPANSKKHSDLYTDENPKGTIHGLGFKDVATSKASVSKIRNSSRSHAHKIQAAVAMEQRAREMGKTSEAAVYRKYINSMKKKTKKMNEAANPAQQAAIAISMKKKGIKPKDLKEQIQFAQMQQRIRDAKEKRREQQKKSEKLYMDTKKKGVKFYDKKGSGRLKDGKKVYD